MAAKNTITTLFKFDSDSGLKKVRADVEAADGAVAKFRTGVKGLWEEFKNNRAAQAAVAGFVVLLGKKAVDAASDLEESASAVQGTFGELADEILAIGENSAESFGMSQRAFNEFAVRFSAFAKQIAERDGRSVVEVTEEMAQRVADFASRHNISLEQAAQVAQSTLAGETESFRRFGGNVSAATVEIFAYKNGIAEVGEELTEGQKVLARYGAFMEQTSNVAGDYARTSDGLANSQRTLSAQVEDLAAAYGDELAPAVAEVVQNISELTKVAGGAENVVGVLKNTAPIKLLNDYNNAVLDFIGLGGDAEVQANEFTRELVRNAKATFEAEFANQRWYETLRQSTQESTYNADANEEMGRIQQATTRAVEAATRAQDAFLRSIKFTRDEVGALKRQIDDREAWLNLADAIDDTKATMDDAAASARDQERATLNLKSEVIRYGQEVGDLPDRVVTDILSLIDQGKLAEAEAALDRLERARTINYFPVVQAPRTPGGNSFMASGGRSAGGPTVVGERGPELVDLPRGSRVRSASETVTDTRNASGGHVVERHIHLNVSGQLDQRAVSQLVEQIKAWERGMM